MNGAVALVLAAGRGERMQAKVPKALTSLGGGTLVARSVERASACASVSGVVVVAPPGWEDAVAGLVEPFRVDAVVAGGRTRQASVRAGLSKVGPGVDAVVCHDAARPFASTQLFTRTIGSLPGWDGVVPVVPVLDTLKRVRDETVIGTEPRDPLALAQTPQAFLLGPLREAHERAARDGVGATDDAALLERAGFRVRAIAGEVANRKITTLEDLRGAEAVGAPGQRVALGFDVHGFAPGRPLVLGGVRFESEEGLAGHSDGDAVCHAIADALLGAAGLGDVGEHFPETDPAIEGIAGTELLAEVVRRVGRLGLVPASADVTVLAERPHVAPARERMRSSLAAALGIDEERLSVKATRPEGLRLTGAGVGCFAIAVVVPA